MNWVAFSSSALSTILCLLLLSITASRADELSFMQRDQTELAEEVAGAECSNIIPGLYRQSRGVDLTQLDLMPLDTQSKDDGYKSPVVSFTCHQGKTRQFDGVTYKEPDQVLLVNTIPSGSLTSSVKVIETAEEAKKEFSANAGLDVATKKFAFSASSTYSKTQSTLLKQKSKVESLAASYAGRRVDLQLEDVLQLGASATRWMNELPESYTTATAGSYMRFIKQFGTHYIAEARFGGILRVYMETSSSFYETRDSSKIEVEAKATFSGIVTVKGGTSISNSQVSSDFKEATTNSIRYYGGKSNLLESDGLKTWMPTISKDPWLYAANMKPIYLLFRQENKRAAMQAAVEDYVLRSYIDIELRRVLSLLPPAVKNRDEVIKLTARIDAMLKVLPLIQADVEQLKRDVDDTYARLFIQADMMEPSSGSVMESSMISGMYECPAGKVVQKVESTFSMATTVRNFALTCSYVKGLRPIVNCDSRDNSHVIVTSKKFTFACPGKKVWKGMRILLASSALLMYSFTCCDMYDEPPVSIGSCSWTDYKQGLFSTWTVSITPGTQVIRGMKIAPSDFALDQKWKYEVCDIN